MAGEMLHAPETDCSTFWEVVQFMGLGIKNHIVIAGTKLSDMMLRWEERATHPNSRCLCSESGRFTKPCPVRVPRTRIDIQLTTRLGWRLRALSILYEILLPLPSTNIPDAVFRSLLPV
jgi:hypothetical protein